MKVFLFVFLLLNISASVADEVLYKWTGPSDEFCTAITSDGKTNQVDRKQCILKAPIQYMWIDKAHQKCGVYTYKNIFIAATETANCESTEVSASSCAPQVETTDTELRALIDGMLYKIIPEVLALKSGEAIPEKIIKEKDSRLVAASIIARLSKSEGINSTDTLENSYDFYHDSEIQMAFNDKNFESIRKGCFRNQFQTNSTNGADAREHRQIAENKLADIVIDGNSDVLEEPSDISHHLRPKYAFFVPTKAMETEAGHQYAENYGNIYAVMKDEVKDRSTFTPQDSLVLGIEGEVLGKKADYKKIRKNRYGYWETQVWGDVCFKDVSHFIINCSSQQTFGMGYAMASSGPKENSLSTEVIAKMKETGIPVYQCKKETKGVNTVYTKGDELLAEDILKRQKDEAKADPRSNFPEKRKNKPGYSESYDTYMKSPEYAKMMEEFEKRKAYLKTPEGKAKALAKKEEVKLKMAADMEAFYKTPMGIKAKEAQEAMKAKMEAYYKTPEGEKAKKEEEAQLAKMLAENEAFLKTPEGIKYKEEAEINELLYIDSFPGGHPGGIGYPAGMGGSYPGMGIGGGYPVMDEDGSPGY